MQPTRRQQEILELLESGMTVRQVAEVLGVTRNAVYLQVQKMRNNGVLPANYTQTGQPMREGYGGTRNGRPVPALVGGEENNLEAALQAFVAKKQRIRQLAGELQSMAGRLNQIAAEMA